MQKRVRGLFLCHLTLSHRVPRVLRHGPDQMLHLRHHLHLFALLPHPVCVQLHRVPVHIHISLNFSVGIFPLFLLRLSLSLSFSLFLSPSPFPSVSFSLFFFLSSSLSLSLSSSYTLFLSLSCMHVYCSVQFGRSSASSSAWP
jgi:hypothetical protein